MGCDIHTVLEEKTNDGWVGVRTFDSIETYDGRAFSVTSCRNYERFAALAGVRGEGPAPKGLPGDLSQTARYLYEKHLSDHHSPSFMSVSEASRVFVQTAQLSEKQKSFACSYPETYFFDVESDQADQYRIVFWFDN